MLKPILLMTAMVTACAVDPNESTSEQLGTTEECECKDDCPPPPPPGPSCEDNGVTVFLDDDPANVDDEDGKVTYCHATGSETNPYVVITTSVNACFAHEQHQDLEDVFPTGGCAD